MARGRPTDGDRRQVVQLALAGLADGATSAELASRIEPLHPRHNTIPGEVFLDLAADAIAASGASRDDPIAIAEILTRYVPDYRRRSRTHRFKLDDALRAAAMMHGGVQPDLLEEAGFWQQDDIWSWSLEALDIYVRAAADRRTVTVADLCAELGSARSDARALCGDQPPVGAAQAARLVGVDGLVLGRGRDRPPWLWEVVERRELNRRPPDATNVTLAAVKERCWRRSVAIRSQARATRPTGTVPMPVSRGAR